MITMIDAKGVKYIKTAYGWLKEQSANWLMENGVFNFKNQSFISDNVGRIKRGESKNFEGWVCLKNDALNYAKENDKKLFAEVCRIYKTSKPNWENIIDHIRLNNLFEDIVNNYMNEKGYYYL